MQVYSLNCQGCFSEDGKPSDDFYNQPLNDKGFFELVCKKAHKSIIILSHNRFDILFEMGVNALMDGYPDAAVTRFATSLERFYEFCIKVILFDKGVSTESFNSFWKLVHKQSERQLGAFLVLNELNKIDINQKEPFSEPKMIEQKWIEFRNDIIHRGYISSYEEAKNYGERIFLFYDEMLKYMSKLYTDPTLALNKPLNFEHFKIKKDNPNVSFFSNLQLPTLVTRHLDKKFDDALFEFSQYSKRFLRN